jgi:hypothetical protein
VKREEKCWCSLFFLFVLCPPMFSLACTGADDGNNGSVNVLANVPEEPVAPPQLSTNGQAVSATPQTSDKPAQKPYGWNIAVYPALAWVPIFGTSVTLPPPAEPAYSYSRPLWKHI